MTLPWTPELDRALVRLVDATEDLTWPERAAKLSAETGFPITDDMARNRHRRVLQDMELSKITPQPDTLIEVPAQPEGQFVGLSIAYFDIETTDLGVWQGEMTVASIGDVFGNVVTRDRFEFEQRSILDDRGLAVWVRDTLETYDILCAWYGTGFDLGYVNGKLIEHGERPLRDMMFIDPMYKARGGRYGVKVGSAKLKNVAKWLHTPNQKPEVEFRTFRMAGYGDPEALATLRDRCEGDVRTMRDIFAHLKPLVRTIHR